MAEIKLLFVVLFVYLGDAANAFVCQQKGIFANPDANDCKTFVVCDSNLNAQVNTCGYNTFFWPEKKGCFSSYNCATASMPGNANPCDGISTEIPDKISADCSTYIRCGSIYVYDDVNDSYTTIPRVINEACPSGTVFKPRYGCVSASEYTCANYQCTAKGYFANPNTNDCSTFIECNTFPGYKSTALFATLRTCPADTKFSPFMKKCDQFYICGGSDPHNGFDPCSTYNWASPFVRNPLSNDCSTYLQCHQAAYYDEAMDVIVKLTCPANTLFSPIVGKCFYNYNCNQSCSKDPCSNGVGKAVDFKSGKCENYLECRDTSENSLVYRPVYEKVFCPPGTLYSPVTSNCDLDYVCPKFPVNYCYPDIPTTPPAVTTTTGVPQWD